jgi:hypothetical protein
LASVGYEFRLWIMFLSGSRVSQFRGYAKLYLISGFSSFSISLVK